MKKSLFLFAILMFTFCVSAFSQNYEQKKKELAQLCKTKVLAEDLDSYIRNSTAPEIAVTIPNVTDQNLIEVMRAINCSKKPVSIVLSANQGFTKIPGNFLFVSNNDSCKLRNIILPSSLKSIGAGAFRHCSGLQYVLFQGKESALESIGESGIVIEEYAFLGCSSLESVTIPNGVKTIPTQLFAGSKSLKSITLPESVTEIAEDAFKGCTGLTDVIIKNKDFKFIIDPFLNCSSIKSVVINGENAFAKCYKNDNGKIVENDKILPISVHIDNMSPDSTISKSNLALLKEIGISTGNDEYDEYLKSHISMEILAIIRGFDVSGTSKSTILNSSQIDVLNRVVIGSKVHIKIELERPEGIKKYINVTLKVTE